MNTFLLIGIAGVYNYGCEAIVRGTAATITDSWPRARVIYASPRPDEDGPRLRGSGVEIVPRPFKRYSLKNVARKALSVAGLRWSPRMDGVSLLRGVDAVFSIGGDIYTLREDQSFDAALPKFGDAALRRGIKYVLWGASVGPFAANPDAEHFFKNHLSRVTMIAAREPHTIDYLAGLGITRNVHPCVDPAFSVAPEIVKTATSRDGPLTVGVNLSPLSLGFAGVAIERGHATQAAALEQIIEAFDARILLIPHVACTDHRDDDVWHLQRVRDAVRAPLRHRVELLGGDPGFIGVKKALVECDLVIAARMHCAINALSSHVPTVLLAYSQKARGMSEYVYGSQKYVLGVDRFAAGQEMLNTVSACIENREALRVRLTTRAREIREQARSASSAALQKLSSCDRS